VRGVQDFQGETWSQFGQLNFMTTVPKHYRIYYDFTCRILSNRLHPHLLLRPLITWKGQKGHFSYLQLAVEKLPNHRQSTLKGI